jgi:hypothetical protein
MSKTTPDQTLPVVTTAAEPVAAIASKTVAAKPVAPKTTSVKPVAAKSVAKAAVSKVAAVKKAAVPKAAKVVKEKTPKLKMERDSFTMPKIEYAQFHVLKERLQKLEQPVKKSELLRAGIMQLSAMTDAALKAAMSKVPTIKTGRPKNK